MARRQVGQLDAPDVEICVASNEEGLGPLAASVAKAASISAAGAGVEDIDLQPGAASSGFHVPQCGLGTRSIGRIDEHCNASHSRHQLAQKFEPLCRQLSTENIDPCLHCRPAALGWRQDQA